MGKKEKGIKRKQDEVISVKLDLKPLDQNNKPDNITNGFHHQNNQMNDLMNEDVAWALQMKHEQEEIKRKADESKQNKSSVLSITDEKKEQKPRKKTQEERMRELKAKYEEEKKRKRKSKTITS